MKASFRQSLLLTAVALLAATAVPADAASSEELAAVNKPDIRKLAEERRAKLQAAFDNIKTFMQPARDQFNSWLTDLNVHKYLSQDLTIAGIDAAKDPIAKTRSEGEVVQQTMERVIAELNSIAATLTLAKAKK